MSSNHGGPLSSVLVWFSYHRSHYSIQEGIDCRLWFRLILFFFGRRHHRICVYRSNCSRSILIEEWRNPPDRQSEKRTERGFWSPVDPLIYLLSFAPDHHDESGRRRGIAAGSISFFLFLPLVHFYPVFAGRDVEKEMDRNEPRRLCCLFTLKISSSSSSIENSSMRTGWVPESST